MALKAIYVAAAAAALIIAAILLLQEARVAAPTSTTSTSAAPPPGASSTSIPTTTVIKTSAGAGMACIELAWPSQAPSYVEGGRYIMQINMWNLKNASGSASLKYCNGTFYYSQDLADIAEVDPNSWVAGYPEVWFGYKPWAKMGTSDSPLPATVAELLSSGLEISVNYSISPEARLPADFALDIWVTKSPNEDKVGAGEQEIMIWLYYQAMQPAGSPVGRAEVPVEVDGVPQIMSFTVVKQPSLGGGWEYIAFLPPRPLAKASIKFNLADFLRAAAKYTGISNYGQMWVNDVELGSEFGSPFTTSAKLSWTAQLSFSRPRAAGSLGPTAALIPNGTTPASASSRSSADMMAAGYIGDGYVMITPYPWNSKAWSGLVSVSYNGSAVAASVDEIYQEKYDLHAPVLGYPSVRYGCDPLFSACTAPAPVLPLPAPVEGVGDVLSLLDYSVSPGTCDITDFSYDIWLTKGPGLGPGDYEVMLWLYYTTPPSNSLPSTWWSYLGAGRLTIYRDGAWIQMPVDVYAHFSYDSWSVVVVVFKEPLQGSVGVNLGQLLRLANGTVAGRGRPLDGLKLASIDVGLEYDGPPNKRLQCSYILRTWKLFKINK